MCVCVCVCTHTNTHTQLQTVLFFLHFWHGFYNIWVAYKMKQKFYIASGSVPPPPSPKPKILGTHLASRVSQDTLEKNSMSDTVGNSADPSPSHFTTLNWLSFVCLEYLVWKFLEGFNLCMLTLQVCTGGSFLPSVINWDQKDAS